MKNNMLDYPLQTAAAIRIPQAMQGVLANTFMPMSPEDISQGLEEAPQWANTANSVLVDGGHTTAAAMGGLSGAFTGAVLGGAKAGVRGAMVGAMGGGAIGAALGYTGGKEEEDAMRAWVMDFLPWASLQPKSKSLSAEPHDMRGMMDISPMEPFGVLMPLIDTFMGDAGYGQEIPVTGASDAISKSLMGFAGFLAPPMMQRYGMRVGGTDTGLLSLDSVGPHLGGAIVGGAAGLVSGGPVAAAYGAGGGFLAGVNTSRLEEELGLIPKGTTMEPGNPVYDIFLNQWMGMKTWKATPEQKLFNEKLRNDRFMEGRKVYQNNMDIAIASGDEAMFNENLGKIHRTFLQEFANPVVANQKYGEYLERRVDKLGAHPQLRRYSMEELKILLQESIAFAEKHRTKAAQRKVQAIREEVMFREINRERNGLNVGGYDYDIDLATGLKIEATRFAPKKYKKRKKKGGIGMGTIGSGGISSGGIKSKGIL
jgi:hypothetical protein